MSEEQKNEQHQEGQETQTPPQNPAPRRRPMTDMERMQARKRRDIEFKKRAQALRDATAEQKEEIYKSTQASHKAYEEAVAIVPKTFKEKWANYWYHYKVATWVTVFVVIVGAYFVYDMVTKDKYDLEIMSITTNANSSMNYDELSDALSKYVVDENGDKKQNVSVESVVIDESTSDSEDPNFHMAQVVKYQTSISEVMHVVYLMDKENYDNLKEMEIEFVDLSQYSDNPDVDGDKFYVKNDPDFASLPGKDNLMLVVRDIEVSSKQGNEKAEKRFEKDLEAVKKIIQE